MKLKLLLNLKMSVPPPEGRFKGLSPLLWRLGPILIFSLKAHTIFSRLLALCFAAAGTEEVALLVGTLAGFESTKFVWSTTCGVGFVTVFSLASVALRGILTGWLGSGGPTKGIVDGTTLDVDCTVNSADAALVRWAGDTWGKLNLLHPALLATKSMFM